MIQKHTESLAGQKSSGYNKRVPFKNLTWNINTQVRKQQLELDMEQQTGSK